MPLVNEVLKQAQHNKARVVTMLPRHSVTSSQLKTKKPCYISKDDYLCTVLKGVPING